MHIKWKNKYIAPKVAGPVLISFNNFHIKSEIIAFLIDKLFSIIKNKSMDDALTLSEHIHKI